jgi:hypothetical protein
MKDEEYHEFLQDRLIEYSEILVKDRDELLNNKVWRITFDYFCSKLKLKDGSTYNRNHNSNVLNAFKRFCKGENGQPRYKDFAPVTFKEYSIFIKCNNAGLLYLKKPGIYRNCYGYDFSMSYPTDMASKHFRIPTCEGVPTYLKALPTTKTIKYGIYHVRIRSKDWRFNQIFGYSSHNYYTHWSLMFCLSYQRLPGKSEQYNPLYDIEIELIIDENPNALIYEETVTGSSIFGNWYHRMKELKEALPGNHLPKMLSTPLWGNLNHVKTIFKSQKEYFQMNEEGYEFSTNYDDSDSVDYITVDRKAIGKDFERYELLDTSKPIYKYPLRLLPFITLFSRYKMMKLVCKNNLHSSCIRIQTDGIIFTKPLEIEIEGFRPDSKISGDIEFKHVNDFDKIN